MIKICEAKRLLKSNSFGEIPAPKTNKFISLEVLKKQIEAMIDSTNDSIIEAVIDSTRDVIREE